MLLPLKIALAALRTHRLRTILAIVGVLLGALALTAVQHVGKAMYAKAEAETAKLGTNLFLARSGQMRLSFAGGRGRARDARTFTLADATALMQQLPAARLASPFASRTLSVRSGTTKISSLVLGVWPEYAAVRDHSLAAGRFLSAADEAGREKVCVLGSRVAERLFGSAEAALGQPVFFFRASARVVGVLAPKGADLAGTDQDDQILVPLSTYLRRFANQSWISGVYIQLAQPGDEAATRAAAAGLLRLRHHLAPGAKDDFTLVTARDTMQLQAQALELVQTLGWISSGVSFAVGGLGILSIMILLVRTRRLEIGIRRAVGATRRDIVRQFMLEAGVMAGIGGLCGVILGMGLVLLVTLFGQMPLVIKPLLLVGTLFGSLLLGLAAGAYPAWQAAQVEVLEVLRNE